MCHPIGKSIPHLPCAADGEGAQRLLGLEPAMRASTSCAARPRFGIIHVAMSRIFLSYRRQDQPRAAAQIYDTSLIGSAPKPRGSGLGITYRGATYSVDTHHMTPRLSLLLPAVLAIAASTARADDPILSGDVLAGCDVRTVSAGEWVEHSVHIARTRQGSAPQESKSIHRLACVVVDAERIIVEESSRADVAKHDDERITRYELDRKTGRLLRAWRGPALGEGAPLEVRDAGTATLDVGEMPGIGVGSREVFPFDGRGLECIVVLIERRSADATNPYASRFRALYCADVPFARVMHSLDDFGVSWTAKPAALAGVVRIEDETTGASSTAKSWTTLLAFGKDATPRLKVK